MIICMFGVDAQHFLGVISVLGICDASTIDFMRCHFVAFGTPGNICLMFGVDAAHFGMRFLGRSAVWDAGWRPMVTSDGVNISSS